ncbi:MAG: thioredoxin family protein [Planctomycetota bacterium]
MKYGILAVLVLSLTAGLAIAQEGGDEPVQKPVHTWLADYDQAVTVAKEQKKDLLVDFTGSDWCGWCIRLDKEVFEHDTFLEPVTKNYVLVKLDFPRGEEVKAKVPNPKRNDELQEKWAIQGFPTILLVSAEGEVYARTGYQRGGPEAYVKHLEEISAEGKKALAESAKLAKEFEVAEGDAKIAVVESAIKWLAGKDASTIGIEKVAGVAKAAITLDPKNEKGMQERALKALLGAGQSDAAVTAAVKAHDPKNEKGLYEHLVMARMQSVTDEASARGAVKAVEDLLAMGSIKDQKLAADMIGNCAFWCFKPLDMQDKAKFFATKLKDVKDLPEHFQKLVTEILGKGEEADDDMDEGEGGEGGGD